MTIIPENPVPLWADCFLPTRAKEVIGQLAERDLLFNCLPRRELIFRAFEIAPQDVSVCILGQDPYPSPLDSNGLAFSSHAPKIPASLRNIFKELESDLARPAPTSGDLTPWFHQNVMLVNAALTIGEDGRTHVPYWLDFTKHWVRALAADHSVAWVLWGKNAQAWQPHILEAGKERGIEHAILSSAHPSPLSARHGFWGSKPFSKTNDILRRWGKPEIDWAGPPPAQISLDLAP